MVLTQQYRLDRSSAVRRLYTDALSRADCARADAANSLACEGLSGRLTSLHVTHKLVSAVARSLTSLRCRHPLQLSKACPVSSIAVTPCRLWVD
jgi:hypothetical protein